MRSISIKIFLVLLVVSLVGALFTTFYIQYRTRNAFDTYIRDQNQYQLADQLIAHYQENGSWENVEAVFREFYGANPTGNQGTGNQGAGSNGTGAQGRNLNRPGETQPPLPPFVLADQTGVIVGGTTNHPGFQLRDSLPDKDIKASLALEIDGEVRGYLAAVPISPNRNFIQQAFLETVQQGLLISSLATLLIALVLGGILIMSFTRPIRKLVGATERVASGELGYQVDIKSSDELGRLADSFNSMSKDLKNADRSRKQMTADIAHDLRTPLSILHGYTEAMNEGKLEGSPEIYKVMHQQAQHLNYLIEDLRTLSLLDSEELNFQIQEIDPAIILQQTLAAFQPLAQEKGLSISLDIRDQISRLKLDPDRLMQIMGNLVSNAVNVLPEGGRIWIKAWNEADQVSIEVKDDGPGISAEDLHQIFDRHYRIDKSRSRGPGSSGLGLAITKKLVEAQGGVIGTWSEVGQGTSFTI
ncbi:MAG: sensor histidine kinase, partial [Anaerolineales bacterium]